MSTDDQDLSRAFKSEAARMDVPRRPRGQGRSRFSFGVALVTAAVVIGALALGRTLGDLRAPSPAATAPSPTSAAATNPALAPVLTPTPLISDAFGLIVDGTFPVLRSESDPAPIAMLGDNVFKGEVSPDGRSIAYWETRAGKLWLLNVSDPRQPRLLVTLPHDEIVAVSAGGHGVAWSSDGTGLVISVKSTQLVVLGPNAEAIPLYTTLRQVDVASGSVREIFRSEHATAEFSPLGWDRERGIYAALAISRGGLGPFTYVLLRQGEEPAGTRLPAETITTGVRVSPDGSRVLMRSFFNEDDRAVYVWPLAEPEHALRLAAEGDEYIAAAVWRDADEIVVSLSTSRPEPGTKGERLEVWTLEGERRVLLGDRHRLDAVRPDGSAAITDLGVVDIHTGALAAISSVGRVLASIALR